MLNNVKSVHNLWPSLAKRVFTRRLPSRGGVRFDLLPQHARIPLSHYVVQLQPSFRFSLIARCNQLVHLRGHWKHGTFQTSIAKTTIVIRTYCRGNCGGRQGREHGQKAGRDPFLFWVCKAWVTRLCAWASAAFPFTCSLSASEALKVTARRGSIGASTPVLGLRPTRSALSRTVNTPKPESLTCSPLTWASPCLYPEDVVFPCP
jgi:hypothetical protein